MLGLRVTPEMKQRLDAAAEQSGRSQSQEAEFRLERSFDRNDLLTDTLALAYGRELAGLLLLLGIGLSNAGKVAHGLASHSPDDRRLAEEWRDGNWRNHPYAYDQALEAARIILDAARPAGASTPPAASEAAEPWVVGDPPGRRSANHLLSWFRGIIPPPHPVDQAELAKADALLGQLANRIKQNEEE